MPSRLTAFDASFLFAETSSTPLHSGGVAVFSPPVGGAERLHAEASGGFDHERLVRLISQRLPYVPRYRQRVRNVPFGIARPVWVDDEKFDVTYHVRRSALPKPGSMDQLHELVARIMSRPLDRSRPLWEMYLVEGLADGNFAIITKSHEALIDGLSAVDIAQVMLDPVEETPVVPTDSWRPRREPTDIELLSSAFTEIGTRPAAALEALRDTASDVTHAAVRIGEKVTGVMTAALALARPPVTSPLNVPIGEQRRFTTVDLSLADIKDVRRALGGTINDVMLTVISGALRSWLQARGHPVRQGDVLRAMLPVSIAVPAAGSGHAGGNRVSATLVELPIGEADPAVRLQQISYQLAHLDESAHFVGADAIVDIAGFGPPTLHALGARVGATVSNRLYNLVITNVPGPQRPLYAAGSRMLAAYPVVPLTQHQALSIGVISYDGGVYVGLYGDRDALVDIDLLASCLTEAAEELKDRTHNSVRSLRVVPPSSPSAAEPDVREGSA